MNLRWFLKAKRLAQNPPSPDKIKLVLGVLAFCLILFGIERIWGWPAWLTPNDIRGLR